MFRDFRWKLIDLFCMVNLNVLLFLFQVRKHPKIDANWLLKLEDWKALTTAEFGFHKSGSRKINSLLLFLLGGKLHNQRWMLTFWKCNLPAESLGCLLSFYTCKIQFHSMSLIQIGIEKALRYQVGTSF